MPDNNQIKAAYDYIKNRVESLDFRRKYTTEQQDAIKAKFRQIMESVEADRFDRARAEIAEDLESEEQRNAAISKAMREDMGVMDKAAGGLARGVFRLPTFAARTGAFLSQLGGAEGMAKKLSQYADDTDYDVAQLFPPAGADEGFGIKVLESAGENLPTMLATGLGTQALMSKAAPALSFLGPKALKAAEIGGTALGMSIPEVYSEATQRDELGNVILPEHPGRVLPGALLHAGVETGFGISPVSLVTKGKGQILKGLFAKDFIKRVSRFNKKYGPGKTAMLIAKRIFADTPIGDAASEGFEEVFQNPITVLTKHLANNDVTTALTKSIDEMANLGYLKQLSEDFSVGAGVGALYSGGKIAIDKIDNRIQDRKTSMREKQELARNKELLVRDLTPTGAGIRIVPAGLPAGAEIVDGGVTPPDIREMHVPMPEELPQSDTAGGLRISGDEVSASLPERHVSLLPLNKAGLDTSAILPDGSLMYDSVPEALRLSRPVQAEPEQQRPLSPDVPGMLPPPMSPVALGRQYLDAFSRGDQPGAAALRDYAATRGNQALAPQMITRPDRLPSLEETEPPATPRVKVEVPKESTYQRGSEAFVSGITIPHENRTLIRGNSEAAVNTWNEAEEYRARKASPKSDEPVKQSSSSIAVEKKDGVFIAYDNNGNRYWDTTREAAITKVERANAVPSDVPAAISTYRVEPYQGGFRILNPKGTQHSWHTSRQSAEEKAAEQAGKERLTELIKAKHQQAYHIIRENQPEARELFETVTGVKLPRSREDVDVVLREYFKDDLARIKAQGEASKAKRAREKAEAADKFAAEEDAEYRGFLAGKTGLQRHNIKRSLERGRPISDKQMIEDHYDRGTLEVGVEGTEKDPRYRLKRKGADGSWRITKTQYEYAQHLLGMTSKPAAKVKAGETEAADKEASALKLSMPSTMDTATLAQVQPIIIQGNKTALLKHIGKAVEIASNAAHRVIDAFGGAGTYTHYIRESGVGHHGDIFNEWEPQRVIVQKQIRDNPDAVISSARRVLNTIKEMLRGVVDGELFTKKHEELRRQIAAFLRSELSRFIDPNQDLKHSQTVAMTDSPELAGISYVAQSLSFSYLPLKSSLSHKYKGQLSTPGFGAIANESGRVSMGALNVVRLRDAERVIRDASRRLQGVDVRRGDAWNLIRTEAGAGDFVPLDSDYFGSKSYNPETIEDSAVDVWLDKIRKNVLPAMERGASFLITNNWNDYAATELRKMGFTVYTNDRSKGVSKDVRELIAINFDTSTGKVNRRGTTGHSDGLAMGTTRTAGPRESGDDTARKTGKPTRRPAEAGGEISRSERIKDKSIEPSQGKLFTAEYLVADYAAKGLKQASKVIRSGLNLMRSGVKTFAQWARQMVNEFGQTVKKHLRSLHKDLVAFNKRLGRTGAISGRPATSGQKVKQNESADIEARAKADGTWLKAPNGEPSKLNARQWVQVRTQAFKDWFGDWENDPTNASKVVDENGEPLVVYHGSGNDFNVFRERWRKYGHTMYEAKTKGGYLQGLFFSSSQGVAENFGGTARAFFLNIRRLTEFYFGDAGSSYGVSFLDGGEWTIEEDGTAKKVLDDEGKHSKLGDGRFSEMYGLDEWADRNLIYGSDSGRGLVAKGVFETIPLEDHPAPEVADTWVVQSPNQIKSATDNVGTFSKTDPNVLYSVEHLAAKYAVEGLKKSGQIIKRGLELIKHSGQTFAKWARQMVNEFGQQVKKHLRSLYKDLIDFNKRLGRTGAISGRPAGKTAQEILTDKWAKKGLEKAYKFGSKLYNAGKTTFAEWQKYMQQRFKNIGNRELQDLWQNVKNPDAVLQAQPLRDNNVPASSKAFEMLGVKPDKIYADYSYLHKQHQEYFATPEEVKAATEFVLANPEISTTEKDGNGGLVRASDGKVAAPVTIGNKTFKHPKIKIELEKKRDGYHLRSVHLLSDEQMERDKNKRGSAPLDAKVTPDKLTGGSATVETEGNQTQVAAKASSTKNDTSSAEKVKAGENALELKSYVTSRNLVWRKVNKDTYELELTDPHTGETSVVETIRRVAGSDNIWNVDNWTTFDNKGTDSGSFTSLNVAKAAMKVHARDAFNQKTRRENGVIRDRIKDEKAARAREKAEREALKKDKERDKREAEKREKAREKDRKRDEREAKQAAERKRKAEEYIAEGKNRPAETEPEKPKTWREYAKNFIEKAEEVLFDMWAPVRRLQDSILKNHNIKELSDDLNLYQKLETVSGRIEAGTRIFKSKYFDPIEKYLVDNKIDYKAFNRFLAIMHAKERNEAVAERNEAFRITGEPGSGISNEIAAKEIEAHKKNGTFDKFMKAAELTYKLNNVLLDEQVRYGLLSQEQRDAYRRYKNYTPMKSPPDQGLVLDRTALGRRSEATAQLAYIKTAIETVFRRGERRDVIGAAMRLFEEFPDQKLYREFAPPKVQYIDKRTGKVRLRTDMSKLYNNPAVIWMKDANTKKLRAFEIKNTALASAINRQFTGSSVEQTAFRYFARINRYLASVSTAYSPEFIFTNLIRDVQQGAASVGVNLPEGSVKKFMDNLSRAKKAIADMSAGKETADTKALEEFQLAGGKTGYSEFSKLEEAAENLERRISEAQDNGIWYRFKKNRDAVLDYVGDWNDAMETRTRFAGYLTAKEAGFSTQKSAAFAKNMTVNFNKKGTWAPVFNSLYLFSSAGLGGTLVTANTIRKAWRTPKGKTMIVGAIGLGLAMELLNSATAGDDDDEGVNYYDKVPDYIKDANYVMMIPGTKGKYIAIPMPYGLNVLPSIGRNMAASMMGKQTFGAGLGNSVYSLINSFNPLGGDNRGLLSLATVTPTVIKPFLDIATNTTWTGRKLRPDQPAFGSKIATSELYYENNNEILRGITGLLNDLSGGDRYTSGFASFSPADIEHLIESYTGGVGKIISRSAGSSYKLAKGEWPELGNIPMLRRHLGSATDYNTWQSFKENIEAVEDFERARRERNTEYIRRNRWLLRALPLKKMADKQIGYINKRQDLTDKERREKTTLIQKSFNKRFGKLSEKQLSIN